MTTAPINAPQPDGRNAVGIESSAGLGVPTPRDRFRCWRCKENPQRGHRHGKRGLKCACRAYVLTHREWWRMAAIRERSELLPPNTAVRHEPQQ